MTKKLSMLAVVLLLALTTYAQSFEGTIKWSVELDTTDLATKTKMEQSKKILNGSTVQAKMKEMMDANPQMKKDQVEMVMKIMTHDFASLLPKSVILKVKGGNMLAHREGGMPKMDVLYMKDQPDGVELDRNNKTYSVLSWGNTRKPNIKVINTGQKMKIQDYTCTQYIVETSYYDGKPVKQVFWTTREINLDMKTISRYWWGKDPLFYGQIGDPLRAELNLPEGIKVILTMTDIKKESFNSADFIIPPDYKELKELFKNGTLKMPSN
jgi:hypothetical protein